MNRALIGILDIVNKVLALFLIASSTISGYYGQFRGYYGYGDSEFTNVQRILGTVGGFVLGLVLAGLVSGLVAAIITNCRETTSIRELLAARNLTLHPPL